ncbi:dihydroorotase [Prevotella melaninogenica]|uniref:dihydroorotase n=1 Tax=Prevotella TaxID=838 RepID=UPI0003ACD9C0|nr:MULTISPECIES: dihydroorotase [Prevotella]ERJ75202.1 dihydroorotase [Prevotella sp. F0091]QUB73789.1 dihydroorotase [Prevotella melaninogenica]
MRKLIQGGTIVNEGRSFIGSLIIEDDCIIEIIENNETPRGIFDEIVNATGCFVLPGVIDDHVHFREPGLTEKADIESESRAAAYGGVTSYFEMPNTNPQTTTLEALQEKWERAKQSSYVNYSFFIGATNTNYKLLPQLDVHTIPGIKLFMGASTGNMLVDRREALEQTFRTAAELNLPVMTHCEDSGIINENMKAAKERFGEDPDITHHWEIRSDEACWASSLLAVELARKYKTQLHIAHISTARELSLGAQPEDEGRITLEAVIAHIAFSNEDYLTKKALIKCNPSVKTTTDRTAIRQALTDGRIRVIGTDHAPHLLAQKQGGCSKAASGMPMIQFSLVTMLELVDEGVLTIEQMVELMSHAPARLFRIDQRGFLRKGYKADITIVSPNQPWTVDEDCIQSKCKWSPMMGHTYLWRVLHTFCNGHHLLNNGEFDNTIRGERITFRNEK